MGNGDVGVANLIQGGRGGFLGNEYALGQGIGEVGIRTSGGGREAQAKAGCHGAGECQELEKAFRSLV